MGEVVYYTLEGLENLKKELNQLTDIERPRISAQIAEARDKGDLSENAEYDAAKDAQGLLELKIAKFQTLICNARLLDESKMDTSKVLIMSTAEIKNIKTNDVLKLTLVPASEADKRQGKISVSSPIAKGILGKQVGDIADVVVPVGTIKFEILSITR